MRAIVIGASLSGKTTIVKQLLSNSNVSISEMDEELTRLNNGRYPTDSEYKHKTLAPKVIRDVLSQEYILFFTNTDYFSLQNLQEAKEKGFKVVLIKVGLSELLRRNKNRVANEGYEDLSNYLEGMVNYLDQVEQSGLADEIISGNRPTKDIVLNIKRVLNIK